MKNNKDVGTVYLVGAGPGAEGLITVRGKTLLEEADVIVYDRLSGMGPLLYGNPQAKYIDVGKKAGHHPIPQEAISRILVREAKKGLMVVRLKGGDPYVFGRGAEEAHYLMEEGISFEVVPGITSAVAVPSYLGIPVTCREMASSFHVITAHKKQGGINLEELKAYATVPGTLVFLMGVSSLGEYMDGLIQLGKDPKTPACALERGTLSHQRKLVGTIGTLPAMAKKQQLSSPAIILVGEVASIDYLNWYAKKPLAGKKILVTRPRNRQGTLGRLLREEGAEVLEVPTIATIPKTQSDELDKMWRSFEKVNYIALTSPTSAQYFFALLLKKGIDMRQLAGKKIASLGKGTTKVMKEFGILPDFEPTTYDGRHLGQLLGQTMNKEDVLLLPVSSMTTMSVIEGMKEKMTKEELPTILPVTIYDTQLQYPSFFDYAREHNDIDGVCFTSGSTVEGFCAMAKECPLSEVNALCIGSQTAEKAKEAGMIVHQAREATLEALVSLTKEVLCK